MPKRFFEMHCLHVQIFQLVRAGMAIYGIYQKQERIMGEEGGSGLEAIDKADVFIQLLLSG